MIGRTGHNLSLLYPYLVTIPTLDYYPCSYPYLKEETRVGISGVRESIRASYIPPLSNPLLWIPTYTTLVSITIPYPRQDTYRLLVKHTIPYISTKSHEQPIKKVRLILSCS